MKDKLKQAMFYPLFKLVDLWDFIAQAIKDYRIKRDMYTY